jgi:hypothetical protein
MATGIIVGALLGIHRYRQVRKIPSTLERSALGFLFGSSINYFACRQVMEEAYRSSQQQQAMAAIRGQNK